MAFKADTGLVYVSSWNGPRIQKLARQKPAVVSARSTGIVRRATTLKPGDVLGYFVAINPLTGEKKWEVPLADFASSAGMLTTGGGLVFTGKLTGEFIALDEQTGKTLWQFKTGSSVNATAITYTYKGRQYVTVASGLGGGLASRYAAGEVPGLSTASTSLRISSPKTFSPGPRRYSCNASGIPGKTVPSRAACPSVSHSTISST